MLEYSRDSGIASDYIFRRLVLRSPADGYE
jgi:hypothetical protein